MGKASQIQTNWIHHPGVFLRGVRIKQKLSDDERQPIKKELENEVLLKGWVMNKEWNHFMCYF